MNRDVINADTPVIILCGGQGTRIADVSGDAIPKPMVPIGGKPILWHIMQIYASQGYSNFILALGHLGWEIKNYFLNYELMQADLRVSMRDGRMVTDVLDHNGLPDWTITFAETGATTQTGQRIAMCAKYVDTPYFMATYGDGVANIDLSELVRFALDHDKIGTVTSVTPSSRFGYMKLDQENLVTEFEEKPDNGGGHVNGGFFVFKREFLDQASVLGDVMLEREPLVGLTQQNQLAAYRHAGFWEPMDTMREFKQLNAMWDSGRAPWKNW
jgi:glucose-1-phosphate cytidylyltransferase